jgi:hypothetical protein
MGLFGEVVAANEIGEAPPVRDYEARLIAELDAALASSRACSATGVDDVRRRLVDGLCRVVEASFQQRPADYEADLARMNQDPKWSDARYHQSARIPPKYFGGDPAAITPRAYVLHVSLNHRLLDDLNYPEYVALRDATTHYATCAGFFRGPHYYERSEFFPARAKVLRAWGRDRPAFAGLGDRELLHRTSLFVEYYPTWSKESTEPARRDGTIYCLALNDRARDFLVATAPPAQVLIAGNPAHAVLNEYRMRENGGPRRWRWARVPKSPAVERRYRVGRNTLMLGGDQVPALRCGFLKTRSGANSDEDLRVLGRLLAGDEFDPRWPQGTSPR